MNVKAIIKNIQCSNGFGMSSTSHPGGNQVDGLPPALIILGGCGTSLAVGVLVDFAFFCHRKCEIEVSSVQRKLQVLEITKHFDANFLMGLLIRSDFIKSNYEIHNRLHSQKSEK